LLNDIGEKENEEMKKLKNSAVLVMLFAMCITSIIPLAGANPDSTVYDYAVKSVAWVPPDEVHVEVQAHFCPDCNPNDANNPGCDPFTHGYPGPPPYPDTHYMCGGVVDGRYVAVRVSKTGMVNATIKLICNQTNWPLCTIHNETFVFKGLDLHPCDDVTVEVDIYCSWCGHWYPEPQTIHIPVTLEAIKFEIREIEGKLDDTVIPKLNDIKNEIDKIEGKLDDTVIPTLIHIKDELDFWLPELDREIDAIEWKLDYIIDKETVEVEILKGISTSSKFVYYMMTTVAGQKCSMDVIQIETEAVTLNSPRQYTLTELKTGVYKIEINGNAIPLCTRLIIIRVEYTDPVSSVVYYGAAIATLYV